MARAAEKVRNAARENDAAETRFCAISVKKPDAATCRAQCASCIIWQREGLATR